MLPDNSTIIQPQPTDPVPADPETCSLLGTTGLVVQALMGVMVISSLVIKKQLEKRKRSWRIWLLDVSKQLAGQAVVHGLNVLISWLVASVAHNNPCSLYFLNVLIDTTVGNLKLFTWYFTSYLGYDGFTSGKYGNPPQAQFWWKQLLTYLMSIITMKLLVLLPLTLPRISDFLLRLGHWLLDYLSPSAQVIFVMAVFPLIMNIVQFCLVDQVIKASPQADEGRGDEVRESGRGRRRRGGDGEGYSRVPDWEADLESGEGPKPGAVDRALPPSSPLLSAGGHDGYGSTTPSPMGSPTASQSYLPESLNGGSIWSKITGKAGSEAPKVGEAGSSTWWEYPEAAEEGRLSVPPERANRSKAPSPDSARASKLAFTSPIPPPSATTDPPIPADPSSSATSSSSSARPRQQSRDWGTNSSHSQTQRSVASRRLTSDVEREARLTLSPPGSPVVKEGAADEVGMEVWRA
ncbi:hypothetical protein I350_00604 [Cryptococcus amylolentus CBS 6273]|uniref:Vacuolar membrane protein n=1 Tax=Cryptococcus amylolentus CBS 6273 TaxID=1296118 RepID=A0A1E3KFG5_9TREE|nr:hypothetical protein I350_00604 [Cryptococcus amylolentus CBS 6273]